MSLISLSHLFFFHLIHLSTQDPDTGQRHFLAQYGEIADPTGNDYEYDHDYVERTNEFVPTLRPRMFTSTVTRSYNPLKRKHYYHSNVVDVKLHEENGFRNDGKIGRILPLFVMEKRPMLYQVCPQLVELFSVLEESTGATYLTTEYVEVVTRIHQGWRRLTSVGYCVRASHAGVCGARLPLMHLVGVGRKGNDNFYTTDMDEYDRVNTQDLLFRGTGRGPLFMLTRHVIAGASALQKAASMQVVTRALATAAANPKTEVATKLKVTTIPGDGVGPELIYCVKDIFEGTGIPIEFEEIFLSEVHYSRSASIDEVIEAISRNNGVALKGAIEESAVRMADHDAQGINMQLRRQLDLFANVVHIKSMEGIKTRHKKPLDFVIVREQTEGEYSSLEHELVPGVIECLKITTEPNCARIAKFAFDYATKHGRKKVTCVHKANIMKLGDGLFLQVCKDTAKRYPRIEFDQMIIDNTCMQLVNAPEQFDVMVMPNLYGNIVDNLAAGLVGGAGVVTGKSFGRDFVIFEPGSRHSFQQAMGRGIANPAAMILSAANMLEHLHLVDHGKALRKAVEDVIREGKVRTRDLGGYNSTNEFADAVISKYTI
ncbi:hypothetical protein PENTCL1PPCAC_26653 [Pristionchus entomophagus]|uniref:Isocitrate dehydrogenase [NAD] subunit, mitochondrial n=1 Tax=Pristionchus entomophagus TaxID=358040 RepID=A0AAV5UEQ3_9BILA|nr:hypothetical protein PENTCL1PPCAC_26653 [Pristionchus entomophagus]